MDSPIDAIPGRKDFLLRIVEQFREIANEIGAPFQAEAYIATDGAVLRIDREGQEDSALRLIARFVDDGDGMEEKLSLLWECKGEVTKLLGLGWRGGAPDAQAGLDSKSDRVDEESVYAAGKVTPALRADIFAELKSQSGLVTRAPVLRRRGEPVAAAASFDRDERAAHVYREPIAAKKPPVSRPQPDIELLQAGLGELATKGGLKAENVFASFIKAAASPAALKKGDVAAYAQGALLELGLFYAAFLRRDGIRASDLGMEGGYLRDAVVKAKAAFFEQDELVRWQVAREMVTGMRLYYEEALISRGVPEAQAKDMLKSTFGRDASIANDAVAILAEPESAKGGVLTRLLGRKGLE
jgi:hypothetical protein